MGFTGYFIVLITILSFTPIGPAQTEESRFTAFSGKGGVQKQTHWREVIFSSLIISS